MWELSAANGRVFKSCWEEERKIVGIENIVVGRKEKIVE